MIVSMHQPAYLPWLGYFDRILKSDVHVVLDHVQFEKNSMINRNKIRTAQGWTWLTVPLLTKGRFGRLDIKNVAINNASPWTRKHWKTITASYRRTPFFEEHEEPLEKLFAAPWEFLAPLLERSTSYLLRAFHIHTPLIRSSELDPQSAKSSLILELCQKLGATTYISGPFGRRYLDQAAFAESGITIAFHDYQHPVYEQAFPGFEPNLSSLDLLFLKGPEAGNILESSISTLNKQ